MFGLEDELRERIEKLEAQPKIGLCRDCRWWERLRVNYQPHHKGYCDKIDRYFPEDFGCTLHQARERPPSPADPKPILE